MAFYPCSNHDNMKSGHFLKLICCKRESGPRRYRRVVVSVLLFFAFFSTSAQQNPYEFKTGHPRLIMTKYDELALRFVMMENPLAEKLKTELKKDADKLLKAKNIKYQLDRRKTMLSISREYLKRIITLSLAYRIFEEDKYSDKAIDMMMFVSEYPDWNPQHFLDVAEMTTALAIGYDWNFYHLNIKEKEIIRNAIVEKGLRPGLEYYTDPEGKPRVWYKMDNNWNQVCTGGLIIGALAVGEDFPDLKNNIIYHGIKNLLPTIEMYIPDGVWYEGPGYWEYANSYLALMISSLKSALEHDFGLSARPGLDKTADFYVSTISPTGRLFNFADVSNDSPRLIPALFWFAKNYNLPGVSSYYKSMLEQNLNPASPYYAKQRKRFFYLSLPWFDDSEPVEYSVPKAQYFKGMVDILVLQSKKGGKNALYLAAKGGKGSLSHQHLDAGSFVIDADGERWGIDMGSDNYFLPGYFDKEPGGKRWNYYRNTNKSHSTIVIGDGIQYPDGDCKIADFNGDINQPFGIIDLSPAYPEASSVKRGFKLLSDDQMLIRDEIVFDKKPNDVRWGMMTDAQIELMGDKAVLIKNGKKFFLSVFTAEPVEFKIEPAKAWHKTAKDNTGKFLLYLKLNKDHSRSNVNISVVLGRNMNGLNNVIVNSPLQTW